MSLHFTGGRLRQVVEEMHSRPIDAVSISLDTWKELAKLVRLGTISENEKDIVVSLTQLVLGKCRINEPEIKMLGLQILLNIISNHFSFEVRSFIEIRLRQIIFFLIRTTTENLDYSESLPSRSIADSILFKLFRQILNAITSFEILLEAFGQRHPDSIFDANYSKYFHLVVENAREDEITMDQLKQFLNILERRFPSQRNYERRMFEILLRIMQEKFHTNIMPNERNTFVRMAGTTTSDDAALDSETDPLIWINYNNWKIPKYWAAKQSNTANKRTVSESVHLSILNKSNNSNYKETQRNSSPIDSSIASSYCSECLEKQITQDRKENPVSNKEKLKNNVIRG